MKRLDAAEIAFTPGFTLHYHRSNLRKWRTRLKN